MTIYARSDVVGIALSRAHGGCGEFHGRPVVNGAPVKEWAFDECEPCETALRAAGDPHWGGMRSDVPETPDETRVREDEEKRGQRDAVTSQAKALQQIANLPEGMATAFAHAFATAFAQMQAGSAPTVSTALAIKCVAGHDNLASAKFCGECGASMLPPLELHPIENEKPTIVVDETAAHGKLVDLDDKTLAELKDIARGLGVKTTTSRDKQLALIRERLGLEK